jgi:CII-binding regulator of phage lambda lysogenization HflD
LNKEHIQLKKKIDESKTELIQLENNLAFFSTTSSESPMMQEVNAKIKKLNDQIEHWETKVKQIKTLGRELKKNLETDSEEDVDEVGGAD